MLTKHEIQEDKSPLKTERHKHCSNCGRVINFGSEEYFVGRHNSSRCQEIIKEEAEERLNGQK